MRRHNLARRGHGLFQISCRIKRSVEHINFDLPCILILTTIFRWHFEPVWSSLTEIWLPKELHKTGAAWYWGDAAKCKSCVLTTYYRPWPRLHGPYSSLPCTSCHRGWFSQLMAIVGFAWVEEGPWLWDDKWIDIYQVMNALAIVNWPLGLPQPYKPKVIGQYLLQKYLVKVLDVMFDFIVPVPICTTSTVLIFQQMMQQEHWLLHCWHLTLCTVFIIPIFSVGKTTM